MDINLIKRLIEDLSAIRNDKINKLIAKIRDEEVYFKLNNLCSRELEQIRPFLVEIYNVKVEFYNLKSANEIDNENKN